MLQIPILHVNGENPEAVAQAIGLAMDFRDEFQRKDVIIDMYCYRRYGHNEGDEPAFTQPDDVPEVIRKRKSVRESVCRQSLARSAALTHQQAEEIASSLERREAARAGYLTDGPRDENQRSRGSTPTSFGEGNWQGYVGGKPTQTVPRGPETGGEPKAELRRRCSGSLAELLLRRFRRRISKFSRLFGQTAGEHGEGRKTSGLGER